MLEQLLAEIRRGGTLQPAALAARLKISVSMVQAMLENLERMGKIQQISSECGSGCGGCALGDSCGTHPSARVWLVK